MACYVKGQCRTLIDSIKNKNIFCECISINLCDYNDHHTWIEQKQLQQKKKNSIFSVSPFACNSKNYAV